MTASGANGRRPRPAGPDGEAEPGKPLFRVVAGHPAEEEVAAVTAVLAAKLAAGTAAPPASQHRPAASAWSDRARQLRLPLSPGPDAWRRSAWPG